MTQREIVRVGMPAFISRLSAVRFGFPRVPASSTATRTSTPRFFAANDAFAAGGELKML
jgi:hypothetical protein